MELTNLARAESAPIESRGTKYSLFAARGNEMGVDFNINRLLPGKPPGKYHLHSKSISIYYVLEGTGKFVVNGREVLAQRGDAIYLEKNEPHSISNAGESELLVLEIYSPGKPDVEEVRSSSK
jgi:mannose-6-phosphate isomerase-like protein (cupin superfamily)